MCCDFYLKSPCAMVERITSASNSSAFDNKMQASLFLPLILCQLKLFKRVLVFSVARNLSCSIPACIFKPWGRDELGTNLRHYTNICRMYLKILMPNLYRQRKLSAVVPFLELLVIHIHTHTIYIQATNTHVDAIRTVAVR